MEPRNGSVWQNNKTGNWYNVWKIGKHSETMEPMVAYENAEGEAYFRPLDLFLEKFTWKHD